MNGTPQPLNLVIVGSSTGGPKALTQLFNDMPQINAAVIVVQHMPHFINESICRSIDRITAMECHLAKNKDRLKNGHIYIAPSDVHLKVLCNHQIELEEGPKVNWVCPAIDVTMESILNKPSGTLAGIILTGMGSDGARGIQHLKKFDAVTYAQSEESSAIFSMPRSAIRSGCIDEVLSPEQIHQRLVAMFTQPLANVGS